MTGRTLSDIKVELAPHLTYEQAIHWDANDDGLLWIEYNIFPLINFNHSINSTWGEVVAEHIEETLEAYL